MLAGIEPDGTVSTNTALEAFALVLGPVPGVRVPSGTKTPIGDGGEAIRWTLGHWNELDAAQRTAVQQALAGKPIVAAGGHGRDLPRKGPDVASVVNEMLAR